MNCSRNRSEQKWFQKFYQLNKKNFDRNFFLTFAKQLIANRICWNCSYLRLNLIIYIWTTGRVSAVGIATRFGLGGPGIESFQTGPGAHPASYTMGTGSSQGVKRPLAWCWPPTPTKCRSHERVGLYLFSPSGAQWPVLGRTLFVYEPETKRQCTGSHQSLQELKEVPWVVEVHGHADYCLRYRE